MDLVPNTWYRMGDIFDGPAVRLADRSSQLTSGHTFCGGRPQLSLHPVQRPEGRLLYLQISLEDVDVARIDSLPAPMLLQRLLLRDHLVAVRDAVFAYDVIVRCQTEPFLAEGLVCLCVSMQADKTPRADIDRKRAEVQTARQRGLLDDFLQAKADFRLAIKPMKEELAARQRASWVPEGLWVGQVIFAHWFRQPANDFVLTPVPPESTAAAIDIEFQFVSTRRRRGFRVQDLFKQA